MEHPKESFAGVRFSFLESKKSSSHSGKSFFYLGRKTEKVRFELTVPRGTTVFKTAAFGHSATSPESFSKISRHNIA